MPFYQFNSLTGSIKGSTHFQPLYPLSPTPLQKIEPPAMIYTYEPVKTTPAQMASATSKAGYSTLSPKIASAMKKFQADLNKPVYLAGGKKDRIIFGITIAMAALSFGVNMNYIFKGLSK